MGTVSKLGLILKEKEDGTMKRRIIIDLRRSGGNSKSALPERLTLPRPVDAVRMATFQCEEEAALKGKYYKFGWDQNWHTAWLLGAFVEKAKAETKAGGPEAGKPGKTTRRRNQILAFILTTMAALGFKVSYKKGLRGQEVTWCGVTFNSDAVDNLILGVNSKFLTEFKDTLKAWGSEGMAPIKDLRRAAGKAAWMAGTRWAVQVLYGVLHSRLKEVEGSQESQRRKSRKDQRNKNGLFYVKRLNKDTKVTITTDASPLGLGGVLAFNGIVVKYFEAPVTPTVALHFGQGTQGAMEALALLLALFHWRDSLASHVTVTLQSDGVVALAMAEKLTGKSPALNRLGAESCAPVLKPFLYKRTVRFVLMSRARAYFVLGDRGLLLSNTPPGIGVENGR
eukprot:s5626_g7.t1